MQLTMYRTYLSDFVSEAGYTKNRIQYADVNKWAVLFKKYQRLRKTDLLYLGFIFLALQLLDGLPLPLTLLV